MSRSLHPIPFMLMNGHFVSDLAIGCPYGGEDGQGLVFIYTGHGEGLMDSPAQILAGQWAYSSFPASFGFSLRGNTDLDQNGYPGATKKCSTAFHLQSFFSITSLRPFSFADLLVGAFGVDKAVLYR